MGKMHFPTYIITTSVSSCWIWTQTHGVLLYVWSPLLFWDNAGGTGENEEIRNWIPIDEAEPGLGIYHELLNPMLWGAGIYVNWRLLELQSGIYWSVSKKVRSPAWDELDNQGLSWKGEHEVSPLAEELLITTGAGEVVFFKGVSPGRSAIPGNERSPKRTLTALRELDGFNKM